MKFINKTKITSLLFLCALFFLLVIGFRESAAIRQFSGISLRFNEPINGQAAARARQYSIANSEDNPFWPTFWHENRETFSIGDRTVQANSISFSGDAGLVWPAEYILGSAPSSVDSNGITVSEALAHRLWGSTDIVGMTVYVNNTPRIIRGVFKGDAELALLSFHIEDTLQSWTVVELTGGIPHPTRNDAESFALASGLGRPDYILMGGPMAIAYIMSIFPFLMLVAYTLVLLIRFVKKYYNAAGAAIIITGLILCAVLLPLLLNNLPPWLIPTHWSDFSFWSTLFQQANNSLREFFSANPLLRDVELKMHLLRQTGIFFLSVCCSVVMITRGDAIKA